MDREATLKLLAAGPDAWMLWTEELLNQRNNLEKTNRWATQSDGRGSNSDTREWLLNASCDFSTTQSPQIFEKEIDLSGLKFPGRVSFVNATFKRAAVFARAQFLTFANFQGAVFCGEADFDDTSFSGVHPSEMTNISGANRIPNARFSRNVDFSDVAFQGKTGFRKAKFARTVWFNRTNFCDEVWFRQVRFSGDAPFWQARFYGDAQFMEAHFDNEAWFKSAVFNRDADFTQAEFSGGATFGHAKFLGTANFRAAQCRGAFSFEKTKFYQVPDFVQAHFFEAPQWDSIKIEASRAPELDLTPRFRALKRLAIQSHDYAREHEFFVGELKSARGRSDLPGPNFANILRIRLIKRTDLSSKVAWRWSHVDQEEDREPLPIWPGGLSGTARFWLGWCYQCFSNFGRSLVLPVVWWLLATGIFASAYLAVHVTRSYPSLGKYGVALSVLSSWSRHLGLSKLSAYLPAALLRHFHHVAESGPGQCLAGTGDPFSAAIGLAIRKGLVLSNIDAPQKLSEFYACLYGIGPAVSAKLDISPGPLTPVIPDVVSALGILQFLLSAILIFLFGLAIRNHFRIK